MKKRQRKKLSQSSRMEMYLEMMNTNIEHLCRELQDNMTRVTWLLKENTSLISRFPIKVEDWVTNPPIHNGDYIVYFVRKDGVHRRFYTFANGKWHDSQRNEVDIKSLYPSCWLMAPVLDMNAVEIYRRRGR